jgi:DNA-binding transcriptional regulator YhcF (GntR family)
MESEQPVFVRIVTMIEDDILSGAYNEDDLIISTPQIAKLLKVNPTTAQRAIGVLTDRGIIYKQRGIGMAVTPEARDLILQERRKDFYEHGLPDFIEAAGKIGISVKDLLKIIKERI